MPRNAELRALQIAVAIGGVVPVSAGLAGVLMGQDMAGSCASDVSADSHFRYLSGLLLGIGFAFWSTIPNVARHARRFRMLTAIVFLGGMGRLLSFIELGAPSASMLFGLAMELIVTPALCLWQARIAASAQA
jgi:hypothetical protein